MTYVMKRTEKARKYIDDFKIVISAYAKFAPLCSCLFDFQLNMRKWYIIIINIISIF